jgi:N-acetylneuraminate synthase/N,N'-diacetyllegionaminate synthase
LGIEAPLAAAALGAKVIEKHLTLDRGMPGPDHSASLEPAQFQQMVAGIRRVSAMLGDGVKRPTAEERDTARVARRSVAAAVDIAAGTVLTEAMLVCRRPATGIEPRDLPRLMGRVAAAPIHAGTALQWGQIEGGSKR